MAQAIEDGYLVPFKIYKVITNIDKTGLRLSGGEEIIYDDEIDIESEVKDFYRPEEFEREITLPDRTEAMCKRFLEIMERTGDKYSKTIIFCVDTQHAEAVRDTLNRLKNNESFATKIVYEDKDDLTIFRDAERVYPLVATTVDLLSTGIDIPHLKNIVFMRPISSKVLFKQIIGRGSRLSSGKGFFRIVDFTNATRFIDEWDKPKKPPVIQREEPQEPFDKSIRGYVIDKQTQEPVGLANVTVKVGRWDKSTVTDESGYFELKDLPSNPVLRLTISKSGYYSLNRKVSPNSDETFELKPIKAKPKKLVILGVNVVIEEEIQIELDGNYVSYAEYRKYAEEKLKEKVHTLDDLRKIWIDDFKRKELLDKLKEEHVYIDLIRELEGLNDIDSFDVIARIVFNAPLITKDERIRYFINKHLSEIEQYGEDIKEIVFLILEKYKRGGIQDLSPRALRTPDLEKYSALSKFKARMGVNRISEFFDVLRAKLYS